MIPSPDMKYYDIHTHRMPSGDEVSAIVNIMIGTAGEIPAPANPDRLPLYCSCGIHPWYIGDSSKQFDTLKRLASRPDYVAIGEAGLDKRQGAPMRIQLTLFEAQARLAEEMGKPLLIHSVKAWPELIAAKKRLSPAQPWIVHGFRGNGTLAVQLLDQGFRLSFGARFHPEAARAAWPDCLFAETDEAADTGIRQVYASLAAALEVSPATLAAQLAANVALFGLAG